jgi:hypothetical protein
LEFRNCQRRAYIGYIKFGYIKFQYKENAMTTATTNFSQARNINIASRGVPTKQAGLSLADLLDVVQKALAMARSLPQTGSVSARQVEQLRAMAASM